ncbi:MAG TPA: citrate lyase subunit alpha, partial [bacterium]|nr:citrate lyase subunit alpha [bacterium]
MPETKLVKNAAGRMVPTEINGKEAIPYKGVAKHRPTGRKAAPAISTVMDYPDSGDKTVPDIKAALKAAGIKDGMTVSTHHHLRNGDFVANAVFEAAAELGVKDLMWFPSASFPCHKPIIDHMKNGVIHHIEGSMNGPLGRYCSEGNMRGMGVLRSHGGRYRAVQDGDVHVDIAVIAGPTADPFGNANGLTGPAACGLIGFALADSEYADKVIVVTDNLIDFPCIPWQIQGNNVDIVTTMPAIGDASKIVSGTTQLTKSPDRLRIAEMTAQFVRDAGIMRDGFSFQAGAGGT